MMSEAHTQQMEILIGIIVFLFVAIIGTIVFSQLKKKSVKPQATDVLDDKKSIEASQAAGLERPAEVKDEQFSPVVSKETSAPPAAPPVKEVDLKVALKKTEENIFGRIKKLFSGQIQESYSEEIEEILYTSDLGPATVQRLMEAIENKLSSADKKDFEKVKATLKQEIKNIFLSTPQLPQDDNLLTRIKWAQEGPTVLMIVGVNGAGKTTSIGKVSALLAQAGKKVLVAAGDTFRAAAEGQLKVWTERAQVEIFSPEGVSDPSAVAYEAVAKAKANNYDVVIVDTAGRLHTQANLMEELKKMKRVMSKVIAESPHETIIVLDANSGQNALMQAREFHNALTLSGAILTKMDGTAKGGVAVGLAQELQIPIKLIGVGERIQDLRSFNYQDYVDSIVG
ncbi:MAG: signal recognition particle-docking protein FtsY [Bdellovibrionia bacterium]